MKMKVKMQSHLIDDVEQRLSMPVLSSRMRAQVVSGKATQAYQKCAQAASAGSALIGMAP
jgi:hypothetical protein